MNILFTPTEKYSYSTKTLQIRVNMLVSWLRSRFQDDPIAYPALNQCRIFQSMVEALAIDDMDDALLKKSLMKHSHPFQKFLIFRHRLD